jgi:hypothetical protein
METALRRNRSCCGSKGRLRDGPLTRRPDETGPSVVVRSAIHFALVAGGFMSSSMICWISPKSETGVSPGDGVFDGAVSVAEFERLAHVSEFKYSEQHARDVSVAAADAVDDVDIFVRRLMIESRPSLALYIVGPEGVAAGTDYFAFGRRDDGYAEIGCSSFSLYPRVGRSCRNILPRAFLGDEENIYIREYRASIVGAGFVFAPEIGTVIDVEGNKRAAFFEALYHFYGGRACASDC